MKKIVIPIIVLAVCAGGGWAYFQRDMLLERFQPGRTELSLQTPAPEKQTAQSPAATEKPEKEVLRPGTVDVNRYSDLDKKGTGWGIKKNKGAEPDMFESTKEMLRKHHGYYMDEKKPKALYLTFDEGYENGYTAKILDTLQKCQVPAAFFVTGPYLEKETELVGRMVAEGHIVGNHTVHHPNMTKISLAEAAEELDALNRSFYQKYERNLYYMRPPEGEHNEQVLAMADDMGYKTIFWSFAYRDWEVDRQKGADYAFEQVTPYLHDGAILLLHAVSKDNTEALERIINYAKEQGYTFRSLDELE